jgi:uncharacterized protein (TIGR04222 family)
MSPFDLRGPEFLLFYLVLGAIVLGALVASRRLTEPSGPIKADLSDPYLIAFLRGGKNELLRVTTISLIHRGLLKVDGTKVSAASSHAADSVRNPLEQELLLYFKQPREASSVFSEANVSLPSEQYESSLEALGLLPNQWVRDRRARMLGLALCVLWGVAIIKIFVALSRGHSNIGFLIILAAVFGFAAFLLARPRLTLRGKAMLDDLRFLFGGLRSRLEATLTSNDVTLLAAVFGVAAIPLMVFPYARTLYPKAVAAGESSSSSCGATTSCGSSDGGGGGSCGGGGCGGGCGGCGG